MKNIKVSTTRKADIINIADYLKEPAKEKSFYIKVDVELQTLEDLDYWRLLSNQKNNMRTVVILARADISKWSLFKMYYSLFFDQIKK